MRAFWWTVSLLIMGTIWILSSSVLGSSSAPLGLSLAHPLDWLGHALEYLLLGYALGRATGRRGLALGLAAWFGAADEVHRAFVAGREAGIQDWLFGLLGAWLGSRLAVRRAVAPPNTVSQEGQPDEPSV